MTIRLKAHTLLAANPNYPRRAECSCGAWSNILTGEEVAYKIRLLARDWHDEHKIEVLRKRGELEEE